MTTPTVVPNLDDPRIAAIWAAVKTTAPLIAPANPYVAIGSVVVDEVIQLAAVLSAKNKAGTTTLEDIQATLDRVDVKLANFDANITAKGG